MPSIEKIHRILHLLCDHPEGLTNKEISQQLRVPPSTSHRILLELKRHDYVYKSSDLRYSLGFIHLRMAESILEYSDVATICLPYLDDLHRDTDETCFLSLYKGTSCITMEIFGHINTRASIGRGETIPLHAGATGKAVLAFLPYAECQRVLSKLDFCTYTCHTISDRTVLDDQLQDVRRTGIAFNFEELHYGINAMATPVFGSPQRVIGALAIVGASIDLDRSQMQEYAGALIDASIAVSTRLGASFPAEILQYHDIKDETAI